VFGVYINCARFPFVSWILQGKKTYETRTKDMLSSLIGKQIFLVETGKGPPVARGTAVLSSVKNVTFSDVKKRKAAMIDNTDYDIIPGGKKYFYKLVKVRKIEPFLLPDSRLNHGRAFTEF